GKHYRRVRGDCRLMASRPEPFGVGGNSRGMGPVGPSARARYGPEERIGGFTKRFFGKHPTCRCALVLVKREAAQRASPILQATKRADLPSTAHLGTREFP